MRRRRSTPRLTRWTEPPPVWPRRDGEVRGYEFSPLYKSVPLCRIRAMRGCTSCWRWWTRSAAAATRERELADARAARAPRCAAAGSADALRSRHAKRPDAPDPGPLQQVKTRKQWPRKPGAYTAEDIEILEDLSPILHRPGMYTDPVNPNHALVEVIDNAADEGLAGFRQECRRRACTRTARRRWKTTAAASRSTSIRRRRSRRCR